MMLLVFSLYQKCTDHYNKLTKTGTFVSAPVNSTVPVFYVCVFSVCFTDYRGTEGINLSALSTLKYLSLPAGVCGDLAQLPRSLEILNIRGEIPRHKAHSDDINGQTVAIANG